jgi:TatD DNase family protein
VIVAVTAYLTRLSIAVNLTDPVFRGRYRGHQKHIGQSTQSCHPGCFSSSPADDLSHVLERSRRAGVDSMIITGGSLSESKLALHLAKEHSASPTCTSYHL